MALTPIAELEDLQLVDTDGERVAALVLDSGAQVPTGVVSFNDGRVLLGQSERARCPSMPSASDSDRIVVPDVDEAGMIEQAMIHLLTQGNTSVKLDRVVVIRVNHDFTRYKNIDPLDYRIWHSGFFDCRHRRYFAGQGRCHEH